MSNNPAMTGKGDGEAASGRAPDEPAVAAPIGPLRVVVTGIDCAGCVDEIVCEINALPGVGAGKGDVERARLLFELDPDVTPLAVFASRLHEMGYLAAVATEMEGSDGGVGPLALPPPHTTMGGDPSREHPLGSHPPTSEHTHPDHSHHGHHGHGLSCAHPPYQKSGAGSSRWVAMLGTVSAAVCLVHCLALPVVLGAMALLPAVGAMLHETAELVLVGVTLVLAWVSVGASYRRHGRRLPLYFLVVGTLLSALGQVFPHDDAVIAVTTRVAGSGFLVAAIWINRGLLRKAVYPIQIEAIGAGLDDEG